ncbi:hypothetical protein F0726_02975 [Acidithiobacillus caldus]|nr:hypothetical protein F0726_02975 [Acidithiobacillus caldus]
MPFYNFPLRTNDEGERKHFPRITHYSEQLSWMLPS